MRLTVVTAALTPDLGLLAEAAASLVEAVSEPVAWRIQLDQADLPAAQDLSIQARSWVRSSSVSVHVDAHVRRAGPGGTRMYAVAAAKTDWVTVLDADDLLPAGSLDRQLALLDAHPDARWAVGAGSTLYADGSQTLWPHDLPEQVPAGLIARRTRDTGHMPTISIAGLWHTSTVLAFGGWPATPIDEDTSLKLALTSAFPGVATPESVYVYRRDVPGQITGSKTDARVAQAARALVLARLRGMVDLGLAPADLLHGDWSAFLSGHSV